MLISPKVKSNKTVFMPLWSDFSQATMKEEGVFIHIICILMFFLKIFSEKETLQSMLQGNSISIFMIQVPSYKKREINPFQINFHLL